MNIVKEFPHLRVWGTIGFIVAMWTISLSHFETSAWTVYVAGTASVILGLYGFTMWKCPPLGKNTSTSFLSAMWLDALLSFSKTTKWQYFSFFRYF